MLRIVALVIVIHFSELLHSQVINPICKPRILIELFTSQGCSNCPNAHKIVDDLKADVIDCDDSLLFLSFHVDYWNNEQWGDTFSKRQFTTRQMDYQLLFNEEGLYTPEFVVNGRLGFIGNNEPRLRRELDAIKNENKRDSVGLKITELLMSDNKLIFSYNVDNYSENRFIYASIISKSDTTVIAGGENAGLILITENNVLNLLQLQLKPNGSRAYINIPTGLDLTNLHFIVWNQDTLNGKISDILVFNMPK